MPISTITNGEAGSSVRTKLNTVIGAVNALGTAANNATGDFATAAQGALADTAVQPADLGGAASLDVGTTAGTVAAGDDSRFSDARTPTAHASSHVTGGTDKIRDATASQDGLMTSAYASKLDGIEAGADVTDASNVATAGALMTSALGTDVATALGVNVGTAGAPVVNGGALGTPSSGTLTSCTGLPVAGIASSTSTPLGVGSLEVGHASDTTLSRVSAGELAVEGNRIYRVGGSPVGLPIEIQLACSDETTALTAGTAKVTFRTPCAITLTAVRASVTTAPTGSTLVVDINEAGTSILSTKLSIDASEKTSTTAATAAVISDTALTDDAEMTIDIDQIGSTIAGAGLKVTLIGTRA